VQIELVAGKHDEAAFNTDKIHICMYIYIFIYIVCLYMYITDLA